MCSIREEFCTVPEKQQDFSTVTCTCNLPTPVCSRGNPGPPSCDFPVVFITVNFIEYLHFERQKPRLSRQIPDLTGTILKCHGPISVHVRRPCSLSRGLKAGAPYFLDLNSPNPRCALGRCPSHGTADGAAVLDIPWLFLGEETKSLFWCF